MNSYTPHAVRPILALAALVVAPASVVPLPAQAQAVLEEVVVTARKREETLQETPIAVSAFDADALRAAQVDNIGDLTLNVPGLSRREGDKNANFNIRGISTRAAGVTAEPGVGVYVDSIYIPRNDTQLVDVLQMESVQVLRGPQGTLFGKNTAGGAILLTTKKPGEELEGFVSANVGDLDRRQVSAGVSGPLLEETLLGGIQLDYRKEDGYREDVFTGRDYGDVDRQSVLGQLRYQTDFFTGDFMLFRGEVDENSAPTNCLVVNPGAPLQNFTAPGQTANYVDLCNRSEDAVDDEEVIQDRRALNYEITNTLAGLSLAWDLEAGTFKSITGYLYQDDIDVGSSDTDGVDLFNINNRTEVRRQLNGSGIDADDETREFFSQEFQFVGDALDDFLQYTVGAFYSKEQIDDSPGGQMIGPGGWVGREQPDGSIGLSGLGFRAANLQDYENTSAAAFGQLIMNLSDTWQLTLGGRYTWEEKTADQTNYVSDTDLSGTVSREEFDALQDYLHPIVLNPRQPRSSGDDDWTEFSPAVTVTMFVPDAWSGDVLSSGMLYAGAANGFKAGGFSSFGEEYLAFDPEDVWTYELGYKLDFWDHRVRLNGAFYYSEYSDIQINVARNFPQGEGEPPRVLNGITNAGEATIMGAEFEIAAMPVEGLLLSATASFIDADYDEFFDEAPQPDGSIEEIDRSDEDFAYTPEQTFSVAASYDWDTELGRVTPRLSGFYKSSMFIGLDPASVQFDEAYLDSFELWNFRLAYQPAFVESLEVAAYVNNLTDEEYFGTGVSSAGGIGAITPVPGKQQTYGVELYYSW